MSRPLLLLLLFLLMPLANAKENPKLFIVEQKTNRVAQLYQFDDPDVKGVTCYVSLFWISMSDRQIDPSRLSVACKRTGAISGEFKNKLNIFSWEKNMIKGLEGLEVVRFYDEDNGFLIYQPYYSRSLYTELRHPNFSMSIISLK